MSKIAISGNASGTATYTIASPAGSTDRVLTLPDEAGTVLTSAGTGNFPSNSVIQVVSTHFTDQLSYGTADGSGNATSISSGFSVVPSQTYVNITAKKANSKFLVLFNGNITSTNDGNYGDWTGGIGLLVDPSGGTSWAQIANGVNSGNTNNSVFFHTRSDAAATGSDSLHSTNVSMNYLYTSSVSAGTTLRFAAEYFHYDSASHQTLLINRTGENAANNNVYHQGGMATTITVMEIAG